MQVILKLFTDSTTFLNKINVRLYDSSDSRISLKFSLKSFSYSTIFPKIFLRSFCDSTILPILRFSLKIFLRTLSDSTILPILRFSQFSLKSFSVSTLLPILRFSFKFSLKSFSDSTILPILRFFRFYWCSFIHAKTFYVSAHAKRTNYRHSLVWFRFLQLSSLRQAVFLLSLLLFLRVN